MGSSQEADTSSETLNDSVTGRCVEVYDILCETYSFDGF